MTEDDLEKLLELYAVPEADPAARERALFQARLALSAGASIEDEEANTGSFRSFWACAAGLAAIALVLFLVNAPGQKTTSDDLAASRDLLRQLEGVFPGNLDAVIERGETVEVVLADEPRPSSVQRVVLTIADRERPVRILSYSGQRVCVDLAGRQLCFEMLVTDSGGVIVAGDDFVWTRENPVKIVGRKVTAERLAQL